jgi:hypothetical protein
MFANFARAKHRSRSHDEVIRVYDDAGNVIELDGRSPRMRVHKILPDPSIRPASDCIMATRCDNCESILSKCDAGRCLGTGVATFYASPQPDNSVRLLLRLSAIISQYRFTRRDCAAVALYAATVFVASRLRFRFKMTCHGFPKACDHKYLFDPGLDRFDHRLGRFDHRLGRFDHRLSKRCSALGCINTFADWSTFKSPAGTVLNSHPNSRACIKSNTYYYADSQPDTITKPSTCRNASPTFSPPQIALHPMRAIRVYDAAGNVIETHEHKGNFKEP